MSTPKTFRTDELTIALNLVDSLRSCDQGPGKVSAINMETLFEVLDQDAIEAFSGLDLGHFRYMMKNDLLSLLVTWVAVRDTPSERAMIYAFAASIANNAVGAGGELKDPLLRPA